MPNTSADLTINKILLTSLAAGTAAITGILTYVYYRKYLKRDVMPTKWRPVGILQQINIFPIKSCGALKLNAEEFIECNVLGLRLLSVLDRALMVVSDKNEMITARKYPKMVLIHTKLVGNTILHITAPGMDTLELDYACLSESTPGKDIHTSVWDSKVDAMLCGDKYDQWFSYYILGKEKGLKLVYYPYPMPTRNTVSRLTKEPYLQPEDTGTFGDATSYMLMNLSSIDDLNTRIPRPVDALQFRGNFHLKMYKSQAYVEDKWQWIRIGDAAIFRVVAPCTRCIFPNINAVTGERDPEGEPLKTLTKYRMVTRYSSPALGIHLGLREAGAVKVNDIIYVEDENE
uniref:MOSC domain-containing protein n=1 Tax=Glossina morsitans morsitans TaxID=37546 RepID=A0A1B0FC14_GLOMM